MIIPVVLCGGSGARLWPLSRKSFPKQFVPLIGNKSLLQLTLEHVSLLSKPVVRIDPCYFRPTEVETLLADPTKAKIKLGFTTEITVQEMCNEMVAIGSSRAKKICYSRQTAIA
jgi:mannose-1-phosphate guanylyltransferase